jgi:ribosomal protein L24
MEIKQTAEPIKVGDAVVVVDESYRQHVGLVTTVHGQFGGAYVPSINVAFVSKDAAKTDPYGAQIERLSSLAHWSAGPNGMPKPGRFWANI